MLQIGGGCKKAEDKICPEWTFYIPNSFSPNSNGINDVFIPKGTGIESFDMWIFDANGNQIYQTSDINSPWNGTVQGSNTICQEGSYLYRINATDACGYSHTYSGTIQLLK